MRVVIRFVINVFLSVFFVFFSRKKTFVVCTGWGGDRFADNSRYMYLYLNENMNKLGLDKIVWLTNDNEIENELSSAGYLVYKRNSLKSVYYHIRAGLFFYDQFVYDLLVPLTKGAKLINMWHGLPIKRFGLSDSNNNSFLKLWDLDTSFLLSCSNYGDSLFEQCFKVKKENMIHGMYPRNFYLNHDMPFLTNLEREFLNIVKKKKKDGKKIIFYLPTFRKNKSVFLGVSNLSEIEQFFLLLDKNDFFFVSKFHLVASVKKLDNYPSIASIMLELPYKIDVYPFLKYTDILVTDYSSVLFDFLYLDRDIICYAYDFDTYKKEDRGFILDYENLPTIKTYTLSDLKKSILCIDKYNLHEQRTDWLNRCFGKWTMENTVLNAFK